MSVRKTFLCFVTILCILAFSIPSFASENDTKDREITTVTEYSGSIYHWTFPYSDAYFTKSDDEFQQELARSSMGLCVASVRDLSGADHQGNVIDKYLRDAGFEDVDTTSYLPPTETDSIACGLGHKNIDDATLIVVGICSANYGKEWGGNLRVGDETDHVGFRIAADKLKKLLMDYEECHDISGKKMLWITGFSRGAAVGNLLSGDLMRDDEYEKLFGYFFATPRTTKEPLPCSNIFNIIVKDDYVPTMPFAEWGYERNGIDMYTFSSASDSHIGAEIDALDDCGMEMTGMYYYNNQSINAMFRTIDNYMCDLFETSAEYTEYLQDLIIQTFDNGVSNDLLVNLSKALSKLTFENPKKELALQGLKEYLNYFINDYVYRGYPEQNGHVGWNSDVSFFENVKREHTLPRYSVWMMADITPEHFFSTNMTFTRLILSTDADLEVYDEYGLLETFDKKLTYYLLPNRSVKDYSYVDIYRNGKQLLINIPRGAEIRLVLKPKEPEAAHLFIYECSYEHVRYSNGYIGMMNLNTSLCTLTFGPECTDGFTVENENGFQVMPVDLNLAFTTNDLVAMENDGVDTISLFDLGMFLGGFLIFVILGIIIVIIFAVRRRQKNIKITAQSILLTYGIFATVCIFYALLSWKYYPGVFILRMVFTGLACAGLSLLALREYLINRNKRALVTFLISVPLAVLITWLTTLYIPFSVPLAIIVIAIYAAAFACITYFIMFPVTGSRC